MRSYTDTVVHDVEKGSNLDTLINRLADAMILIAQAIAGNSPEIKAAIAELKSSSDELDTAVKAQQSKLT
jgi:hypothetical protein